MTDMNGKVVKNIQNREIFDNPTIQIKGLENLNTGMYFITVQYANQQETYKVVKK